MKSIQFLFLIALNNYLAVMSVYMFRRLSIKTTTAIGVGSLLTANTLFSNRVNGRWKSTLCESLRGGIDQYKSLWNKNLGSVLTNPLLKKDSLPLFEEIKPEYVLPSFKFIL